MKNSTLERAATPASGCQKTLQGGSEGRSPPSCIPNSRCLPQIFDLEKASRARAGQAALFQRAACLADMCGGFGSLAQQGFPARFPGRAESAGETRSVGKIAAGELFRQAEYISTFLSNQACRKGGGVSPPARHGNHSYGESLKSRTPRGPAQTLRGPAWY